MKKSLSIAFLALISFFTMNLLADNMQQIERKIDDIKPFEKIEVKGSSEIIYTQDDHTSITIKGPSDLVDLIVLEMDNNTLYVSQKPDTQTHVVSSIKNLFHSLKNGFEKEAIYPTIYVTSPDLISVSLTGSGDFRCNNQLDTDNLNIELKGSGDVTFDDIVCDNLHTVLQGSGDIDLKKVEAINAHYELKGSGDIDAHQQRVDMTTLSLYGSGDIDLFCSQCRQVDATLTGSGDIDIHGQVETLNRNTRGSGEIEHYE